MPDSHLIIKTSRAHQILMLLNCQRPQYVKGNELWLTRIPDNHQGPGVALLMEEFRWAAIELTAQYTACYQQGNLFLSDSQLQRFQLCEIQE